MSTSSRSTTCCARCTAGAASSGGCVRCRSGRLGDRCRSDRRLIVSGIAATLRAFNMARRDAGRRVARRGRVGRRRPTSCLRRRTGLPQVLRRQARHREGRDRDARDAADSSPPLSPFSPLPNLPNVMPVQDRWLPGRSGAVSTDDLTSQADSSRHVRGRATVSVLCAAWLWDVPVRATIERDVRAERGQAQSTRTRVRAAAAPPAAAGTPPGRRAARTRSGRRPTRRAPTPASPRRPARAPRRRCRRARETPPGRTARPPAGDAVPLAPSTAIAICISR